MSFQGLQERLSALQETTSQIQDLISRLAELKFQPGSVPLDTSEEGSVSGELSAEITSSLRECEDERELLSEDVEYLRKKEKTRLREGVERQAHELERLRASFRQARLAARKSLLDAQRLERQLLVKSYSIPEHTSTDETNDEQPASVHIPQPIRKQKQYETGTVLSEKDRQTVGASSRVTDSLRQMHASLQSELERSEYAKQTMAESSAAFAQLDESYSGLETMLKSSRDLLGTLLRSQKSDTWYLTTSFYMLTVVGAWLVYRRWLSGPLWWLVLFPLRILFGVGKGVGKVALKGHDGKVVEIGTDEAANVEVEGIPGSELPTARVAGDHKPEEDVEALLDRVGGVMNEQDAVEPVERIEVSVEEGQPVVAGDDARPRDEL
ncbi:uncharacterized protein J7T54_006160 [Emericellopsis cladophorae]|uniref:Sec20 C-terminal domain-containing protein n=1 Tax=Emericellopsis cladophorae TaxID=2686198 RepID=A0A9P9Y9A9_9HYPO|nr:uncharacterized protein J7T54_006160 [Emericellopsis cladophorae]KAI6785821.1 hypothetical protein J7T54_006160 [Emericellopsis cladophorae]